jgi:hypothetical protein
MICVKELTLVAAILISSCGNTFAQAPDTIWSKIHDIFDDIDEGECVRQTSDGGYIITGSCAPNGLVSHIDLLLTKTDTLGNIIWTKTYAREFVESGFSIEQTSDGGYIIAGRAVTGEYPIVEPPLGDAWILKTDTNGDTLWTRTYGGSGNDYCTSVQQTPDLGYIMAGTMNSEHCYPDYEVDEEYEPDSSRAWLVRTDCNGDTLWTRTYLERSYSTCVVQTPDGGYIIVGWIFPDGQNIQSDVLLIKTDSSGDTLWTKTIGGEDYEIGLCIRQTQDGYVMVGQTKPAGARYDALLIKTDFSGDVLWMKTFGGELSSSAYTVEVTSDGGFFITGTTNGHWWINQGDMWVFKTDSGGSLLWERIYDLRLCDFTRSGIQTSDGGYVVTGMTSPGFGGDLWLARISKESTDIPEPKDDQDNPRPTTDYVLNQNYPNPFNPSTRISYSIRNSDFVVLKIYDVLGREIQTPVSEFQKTGTYSVRFDARELSSGIYFYKLQVGTDFLETKKMLLVR